MWFVFGITLFILVLVGGLVALILPLQQEARINFINQYKFSKEFLLKYERTHQNFSDSQRSLILESLRQYFRMCRASQNEPVCMPSLAVDQAWHEFILFTSEYKEFCDKAFGRFLHHTPDEAMKSKHILQKGIHNAWQLACEDENIDIKLPKHLPKIFSIDARLGIQGAYTYSLKELKKIFNTEDNLSDDGEDAKRRGNGWGPGCSGCGGGGCSG